MKCACVHCLRVLPAESLSGLSGETAALPQVEHKHPTRVHAIIDRVLARLIPERSLQSRLED